MNKHRLNLMALSAVLSMGVVFMGAAQAAEVDDVLKAGAAKTNAAKQSQQRIDKTAEQTYDLLQDFRVVNSQIEGLRVYNAQLDRQIANQNATITDLEESLENATLMERQIIPLTIKMLDALQQFVDLDMPFKREDRLASIEKVRENMDSAVFSSAEKFRQVLELYDIESEYSRTIENFEGMLEVEGQQRQVNFLRVGRIALMYQTSDQKITGAWDSRARQWVQLDSGEYRSAVSKGIRIAKKQAAIDILKLPILAPEAAQ